MTTTTRTAPPAEISDANPPFATGSLRMGLAGSGALRWAVADLSAIVETARGRLDLSPVASAALGRSLAGAALLLRLSTKTPTRLVLEVAGDGPIRRVQAECDQGGNLRGFVGQPRVDVPHRPDDKLAVGRAVGQGSLRVLREHLGGTYQSQVELVSGEIGDDLAHYLAQSEQSRSAVLLGVLGRPEPAGVAAAGGLIVEVMPGAGDEVIDRLEGNLAGIPGVSRLLEEGGLDRVLGAVLGDLAPEVHEESELYYRCRCSRERLRRHLEMMSEEDRDSLREEDGGHLEAECLFCGASYRFERGELGAAAV
ncbi:MAG TPA: Hsp33 family molecular chaperone HslO [Thermoanaerobaculia bacterium]|nr:Hsp33 family molecular chaperone HslO [Thermoanaerobaculia bacterium]